MGEILSDYLLFLQRAENLKNTLRTARTSNGRVESSAEHSWRLSLMLLVFEKELGSLDLLKLLKMAVVHDLAEAVCGDTPAVAAQSDEDKTDRERRALAELLATLPGDSGDAIFAVWEEYEAVRTPEAQFLKGLDKLETILQHNQGDNPPDFDYAFNLSYGKRYTDSHPLLAAIRRLADDTTRNRAGEEK